MNCAASHRLARSSPCRIDFIAIEIVRRLRHRWPTLHPTSTTGIPTARVRCITEMGMGVDVHGKDATNAAKRAVSDAIRHSSLGFFRMLGKTANDMFVDVMIAVPNPEAVDTAAVAKELPYATVKVNAVKGGLEIPAEQGTDSILIANAAVIVSFDDDKG